MRISDEQTTKRTSHNIKNRPKWRRVCFSLAGLNSKSKRNYETKHNDFRYRPGSNSATWSAAVCENRLIHHDLWPLQRRPFSGFLRAAFKHRAGRFWENVKSHHSSLVRDVCVWPLVKMNGGWTSFFTHPQTSRLIPLSPQGEAVYARVIAKTAKCFFCPSNEWQNSLMWMTRCGLDVP